MISNRTSDIVNKMYSVQARFFFLLLPIPILVFVSFPQRIVYASTETAKRTTAPSREQVSRAITLAAGYLERSCGPDGKFVYEVDISSGEKASTYNIVRHAGAMYALGMLNGSRRDQKTIDTIVRAAAFMRQHYIGPGIHPDQLAIWSEQRTQSSDAELGAIGLGLVALTELRSFAPKSVSLQELQALGRFALFLQKKNGSFIHVYRPGLGEVGHLKSPYYPGEAALGFIALYQTDHSLKWLRAAAEALSYIARSHSGTRESPPDHWALIAIARILPYRNLVSSAVSREELVQYAIQVCDSIVRDQFRGSASTGIDGAFDPAGQTAPVGARLEGLLAALEFLPQDQLRVRVELTVQRCVGFLLRAQIKSGEYIGGIPGAVRTSATDSSKIRIDYVQHALCAWLRYQRLIQGNAQ